MIKEDDSSSLLDYEPVVFKGGTLSLSTEDDDADENTSFLDNRATPKSCSLVTSYFEQNPKSYFCYRDELVTQTLAEIKDFLMEEDPNDIQGVWLLTEISFWDNERERVVAITKNYLIVIKYDFIALKILNHCKVPLQNIDTVIVGDFMYPSGSLAPSRNGTGIRAMWNKGEPVKFSTKWNPFASDIPWATFTSHPLLWHKSFPDGEERMRIYDVDYFISRFIKAVQQTPRANLCRIQHKPILLQNYFGLLSIIHNRNGLGFFKVRGKFSF